MLSHLFAFPSFLLLSEKSPDLQRLESLGVQITSSFSSTHMIFGDLLTLAPQSSPVMREYAGFLLELGNDSVRRFV